VDWSEIPIDIYCERLDASFWSEPFNAFTNAAFLIAAVAAWLRYRNARRVDVWLFLLIVNIALIAFGSFVFHTFATRGAALFDTIPIALFVYSYLALALSRFIGLRPAVVAIIVIAFVAVSQFLPLFVPRNTLNGSVEYLPPLLALFVVGLFSRPGKVMRGLLIGGVVFTVSLAFRTVDMAICGAFPLGTHFIWHMVNAWVLYWLMATAIDASVPEQRHAEASASA